MFCGQLQPINKSISSETKLHVFSYTIENLQLYKKKKKRKSKWKKLEGAKIIC